MINTPTIYTSSDTKFFNMYGISFINSFKYFNPTIDIHYHIIDGTSNDLRLLDGLPCNYSTSSTSEDYKKLAVENLSKIWRDEKNEFIILGLKSAFRFLTQPTLEEKLYHLISGQLYRSGRFIELNKMWTGNYTVLAYDVDTICTKSFNIDDVFQGNQGCLSVKGRFVTSLTGFRNNSKLLRDWSEQLDYYVKNYISFGFMDQNTFISKSTNFDTYNIERKYCDHTKKGKTNYVITGKGNTKFNDTFIDKVNLWKN